MKIYLIKEEGTDNYKIGRTSRNINNRLKELQTGSSNTLQLVDFYETTNAYLEQMLHARYLPFKKKGEWFEMPLEDVILFKATCKKVEETLIFMRENNHFFSKH